MLRSVTDRLQRWRDHARRRLAMWIWDRPNRTDGSFQNKVVFIRWDAKLGDTIVLSWVLRELKHQRPDLDITVIAPESFEDLFRHGYGIDSVYMAGKRHGSAQLKALAKKLKNPRYVVHLSLQWRPRDIRFVRGLDPKHVVGLDDELEMVDIKLGARTKGMHFSDKLVPWLEQLGVNTRDRSYWIPRLPQAATCVDQWWPAGRVVGLCPYGASRKKRLNSYWIETMVAQILEQGLVVVFLVLPSDRASVRELIHKNAWQQSVHLNEGQSTQYELFEQVARCGAVISVDTAVVHLAVGLNRPLLALYNSVGIEFTNWQPNSACAAIIRCHQDMSQRDNGLSPEVLDQAVANLLARL